MKTATATEMKMGKVFDVVSLFSTPQRDFLIRNNGEKVKVESLKGKTVAIYFLSLEEVETEYSPFFEPIKVVYDDLSPQNNFQVVLVADVYDGYDEGEEDKELFDKLFSGMPWMAIPQDDKESRRELFSMTSMLEEDYNPVCIILDDKGKIVNTDGISDFDAFGAECYPFTPERIIEIVNNEMLARGSRSVKRFLTTPTCDFLIRSNSEKVVPVSDLEGKVVAFYFYTGSGGESETVDELIDLYEKLRQMGKQFEIVFINSDANEDKRRSYMEAFKRTSWLGLPSNDRSYLKLMRIFRCFTGDLVIVSPDAKFPDNYGLKVIRRCGIEAYPFTRQRVTEMEVERLESLTLESILFSGRCKYIKGNSGQEITAHHLKNKTILLLFTIRGCSYCRWLMPRLIKWYNETKEERFTEDFEIIHIPFDYDPVKECHYAAMPWLQFPYDKAYNRNMFGKKMGLPWGAMPLVIAFGADGKIKFLSKEWERKIDDLFTFTNVDLFSEVDRRVAFQMSWPVWSDECAQMQRRYECLQKQRQLETMGTLP